MKILINAPTARMGGATTHLNSLIDELAKDSRGHEYTFIIDHQFQNIKEVPWIKYIKVNFKGIRTWFKRFIWEEFQLPNYFYKNNYDMLISLLNFGPLFSKLPQIVFERNPIYFSQEYIHRIPFIKKIPLRFRRYLAYLSMKYSKKIFIPTLAMRNMIRSYYPQISSDKFIVLPHGFNENKFLNSAEISKASKKLVQDKEKGMLRILFVSHLAPHKGFEEAIEAISILKKKHPKVCLYLTTERSVSPSLYDVLKKLIKKYSLQDNIVYLDTIKHEEILSIYKNADLFFFPSWCESFGFPMLEAMSVGLPIVAARTELNQEICKNAASYFKVYSAQDAAEKLNELIENKALREELCFKGNQVIKNYPWNWSYYIDLMLKYVSSYVKGGASHEVTSMQDFYDVYWDPRHNIPVPKEDPTNPQRMRLLKNSLTKRKKESVILDAGCGNGYFSHQLSEWGFKTVGFDISINAFLLNSSKSNGYTKMVGSLEAPFPFRSRSFDVVYSGEVIEHLFNVRLFAKECYRVLKPGGEIILTTPYHGFLKNVLVSTIGFEKHFAYDSPHIRFFSKNTISKLLSETGFKVNEIKSIGRVSPLAKSMYVVAVKK